jgi:glycosyltransferase involved in cell wall biosynthesis
MLAGYWAGVPAVAAQIRGVPPALWRRFVRYEFLPLPQERVRRRVRVPVLRRLGDRLVLPRVALEVDFLACRLFDRWVARHLADLEADAVVACEISARTTFQEAKRRGMTTLLDAPSFHHGAQDRLHGSADPPRLHGRIAAVKDEEISLADAILTVSELARETYLEAGCPAEKVHAVSLGADLELFSPSPVTGTGPSGFTFVFAGASIHRKGFDVLVEAFARVAVTEPGARLRVVGPRGELAHRLERLPASTASASGPLDQRRLSAELQRADCLVLPSRNDSFGMVVAEALACGTPVLVSDMVGAKSLIDSGGGWVVPAGDVDALAERMLWCVRHAAEVRGLRPRCRELAAAATWPAYHSRLATLLTELVPVR